MKLLLIKAAFVALIVVICEARTSKRSVEIQPVQVDEMQIDDTQLKPNEVPLIQEIPYNIPSDRHILPPAISPAVSPGVESMEAANTMVFRPLFAYRKPTIERRSLRYDRQHRRGEAASISGYSNYFSNPPPYLVYDRKAGAYLPYYYKNVRRS